MKAFILRLFALFALLSSAKADVTVYVDNSKTWLGYMNVFERPPEGGGPVGAYLWGSGWGVADLRATFGASSLSLAPNTIGDPAEYWYVGGGAPGNPGNKIMAANLYVEETGPLSGQTVTFAGTVTANTLTPAHTAVAFIKDFAPDYSSFNVVTVPLSGGAFSISLATDPGAGRHVQYGFEMLGVNVWQTDAASFGTVEVGLGAPPPPSPNVTVDPGAGWQGFMNIFFVPEPGEDLILFDESSWGVADLTASFAGPVLTLGPNTIAPPAGMDDPDFYNEDGTGNKIMEANLYVELPPGSLAGQTIRFTGEVLSNTLTGAHTAVAFIKDYAPDYSSFNVVTAPLVEGTFNISLATSPDPGRHIQYGFQTTGINVWQADVGPFGSVQVTAWTPPAATFEDWIATFDFSGFVSPDLTTGGDPDADGMSNLEEFAFDGDPASGTADGKMRARIEDIGGTKALTITLPVREAAEFGGSPGKSAVAGTMTYHIEGSNGLDLFDQAVSEVTPARSENLPETSSGWIYRTFRLDGSLDGPTPRGPQGFLRARLSEAAAR